MLDGFLTKAETCLGERASETLGMDFIHVFLQCQWTREIVTLGAMLTS